MQERPVPILIVAADGTVAAINGLLVGELGYSPEELLGQPAGVVLPDDGPVLQPPPEPSGDSTNPGAGPTSRRSTAIARRKDGSRFPVVVRVDWLATGAGTVAVAALMDTTEPRRAEHQPRAVSRHDGYAVPGTALWAAPSPAMRSVLQMVEQVATTDSTVLLLGETGTGKEFLASRIHELSARRGRRMIRVNCAAIPDTLLESELFGHERGAFTGALTRQIGRFEAADGSTIFLDEIGDLPIDVQVTLLRVLEERQFERLGSSTPVRVDARIIAATHRNLEQRIAEGTFRADLFYRLNVFPIVVPPLRDRTDDLPAFVWHFIDQFSSSLGRRFESIPAADMLALQRYSWPGNIRELRNVVERAMILATGPGLTFRLPPPVAASGAASDRLADIERDHIVQVLETTAWRIRGADGAANRLGLAPTTLESRMTKLGVIRPQGSS